MKERQTREIDSINGAYRFLSRQSGLSPELTAVARNLGRIVKRVDDLRNALIVASSPKGDITLRRLADKFRERHMLPLSRRGKVLFRGEPRLERAMRVPHKHDSVINLLAAARAMLAAVRPHKKHFIAAGCREAFLTEFRAGLTRLAAANKQATRANVDAPRIRDELDAEVARGRAEVSVASADLQVWFPTLKNGGAGLNAEWRVVRRIPARQGRPSARRAKNRAAAKRRGNDVNRS